MTSVFKRLLFFLVLPAIFLTGCKEDKNGVTDIPPAVKSFFSADKITVEIDETIQFKNESENADSYTWDFGDGTSSTDKDPSKSYSAGGTYTVSLKAVGPGGTGNYSTVITVIDNTQNNASDRDLYYIEYGKDLIRKINLTPGSEAETVTDITDMGGVGIDYDPEEEKIYYSDFEIGDDGKIWRMNLDGSNKEVLVDGINDPYSIVLNHKEKKIYWGDDDGNISRVDFDGSNLERDFVWVEDGLIRGIAFDSKNDVIYFYEVEEEIIYAVKSDGTGLTEIHEGTYGYSLYIDKENDKLYFHDYREDVIKRMNLDGSGVEAVVETEGRVFGMAIDYDANKFYWSDREKNGIFRANLDGSDTETLITDLSSVRGIFIK